MTVSIWRIIDYNFIQVKPVMTSFPVMSHNDKTSTLWYSIIVFNIVKTFIIFNFVEIESRRKIGDYRIKARRRSFRFYPIRAKHSNPTSFAFKVFYYITILYSSFRYYFRFEYEIVSRSLVAFVGMKKGVSFFKCFFATLKRGSW